MDTSAHSRTPSCSSATHFTSDWWIRQLHTERYWHIREITESTARRFRLIGIEIDWRAELSQAAVRLIVPIAVLRELDNKKNAGPDRLKRRAATYRRPASPRSSG
jgi:hypothetical protein